MKIKGSFNGAEYELLTTLLPETDALLSCQGWVMGGCANNTNASHAVWLLAPGFIPRCLGIVRVTQISIEGEESEFLYHGSHGIEHPTFESALSSYRDRCNPSKMYEMPDEVWEAMKAMREAAS